MENEKSYYFTEKIIKNNKIDQTKLTINALERCKEFINKFESVPNLDRSESYMIGYKRGLKDGLIKECFTKETILKISNLTLDYLQQRLPFPEKDEDDEMFDYIIERL